MKIKLQPGGKLILLIVLLLVIYLLVKVTGLLNIFSSGEKEIVETKEEKVVVKIPDRPLIIGYIRGYVPENLLFANGGHNTKSSSLFDIAALKVQIQETKDIDELLSLFIKGGDEGGIDLAYINIYQLISNYDSLKKVYSKAILVSDIKVEKQYIYSNNTIKTIKDLSNKKIAVNSNYSSDFLFSGFAKKSNIVNYSFDYLSSDTGIIRKLSEGLVSAIVLKDKNYVNKISPSNIKLLIEISEKLTSFIIAGKSTIDNYSPYLKAVIKNCIKANDSLNKKNVQDVGVIYADKKMNSKYLLEKTGNNLNEFENEIFKIKNTMAPQLSDKRNVNFSDLIYSSFLEEILNIPVLNNIIENKDTVKKVIEKNVSENLDKTNEKSKKMDSLNKKTKEVPQKVDQPKTKQIQKEVDKSVISNFFMINFEPNSIDLDSVAKSKLTKVANEIKSKKYNQVVLVGHADSTGEDIYNFIISKRRADTVKAYLSTQYGINQSIFTTVGKGSREPLGPNSDKKWKKLNRRVNIILKNK